MPKTFHPKILTANDLVLGTSVFRTAEGWSDHIADALVATTPDHAESLEQLGHTSVVENDVVGPYLVDVSLDGARPKPLLRREQIRAAGMPSIPVTPVAIVDAAA